MLFLSDTIVGEEFVYEVQRGDSRTRIGARFGENPVVLARDNGLRFPSVLNVGITLNINNRHIAPKSDLIDGICRVHSCTVHPMQPFNLFGSNSPPLGAYTFAVVFGFDTPLLAAGLFISKPSALRHGIGCTGALRKFDLTLR